MLRSVLFAFVAYCNLEFAFSVFYVSAGDAFTPRVCYPRALHFSVVTVATIGDSRIEPTMGIAYFPTAAQLVTGVYSLVIVLAAIVSWTKDEAKA